jgi:hypothetical protein
MNPLFENELVKKYWPCFFSSCSYEGCGDACEGRKSIQILRAMCQPIKRGERYIFVGNNGIMKENDGGFQMDLNEFHPHVLRLPDEFQKKECDVSLDLKCPQCSRTHVWTVDHSSKPAPEPEKCDHSNCTHDGVIRPSSAVEEKIKSILGGDIDGKGMVTLNGIDAHKLRSQLRELVRLARVDKPAQK